MQRRVCVYVCVCDVYVCATLSFYSPAECDLRPERIAVQRGATSIKQVLLDWCKTRVHGYKVRLQLYTTLSFLFNWIYFWTAFSSCFDAVGWASGRASAFKNFE